MKSLKKQLGQFPDEKRKEYFNTLPNYLNGRFQNILETPALLEGESMTNYFFKVYVKWKTPHQRQHSLLW